MVREDERSPTVVRPLDEAGVPAFLALIDALADYERLPRPDDAARERLGRDAFATPPLFRALLAERGGQAVGYAVYFFTYATFLARPTLHLEDLFVLPEARRAGVALALMRALAREAQHAGCGRIEWQVLTWNELAQDFYARLGALRLEAWQPYRLEGDAIARLAAGG